MANNDARDKNRLCTAIHSLGSTSSGQKTAFSMPPLRFKRNGRPLTSQAFHSPFGEGCTVKSRFCDSTWSSHFWNSYTRKMEFPRGEMVLSNSRSWDYFLCRGWIKLFPSFLVRSFLNSCYGLPFLSLVHTGRPRAK